MTFHRSPNALSALSWCRHLLAALFAALTLAACGGGGGAGETPASSSAAPAGAESDTLSQGVITGFGSIIVNGVRFDDSTATVSDEDDDETPSRSKDVLKLGMLVTVSVSSSTGTGTGTGTGTASAITFGSVLKGPVQSINGGTVTGTVTAGTQTLVILGQSVIVTTRTVFDPLSLPGGLADIRQGDVLEVHGLLDVTANKLLATRINREGDAGAFKITGNVSSLDTASSSFKIGSLVISYAAIEPGKLRVKLANGVTVKVQLSTMPSAGGTWNATRIKPASRKAMVDRKKVEIEGIVDSFTSVVRFSVNGVPVDATHAAFSKGASSLALGARVEIEGSIVGGTLIATRIKIKEDKDEDHEIELHGVISSVDAGSLTFVLRGLTVSYAGTVKYEHGSAAGLVNGARVEVKGQAAAAGTTVQARKIEFED